MIKTEGLEGHATQELMPRLENSSVSSTLTMKSKKIIFPIYWSL